MAVDAHDKASSLSALWAAFQEDAERILMAVERKRASVSAAEHRRGRAEANAVEAERPPQTRDELRAWAAGRGFLS